MEIDHSLFICSSVEWILPLFELKFSHLTKKEKSLVDEGLSFQLKPTKENQLF